MYEQINFRQYHNSDNSQVKKLHKDALRATGAFCGSGEWDRDLDRVEEHYIKRHGNFLVGVLNDEVIAMGAYAPISKQVVEIKRMRVKPALQGQGIGHQLLKLLETEASAQGYTEAQLDTTVLQIAAQRLYRKNGYTETHRETNDWPLETIFYRKRLT